MFIHPNHGGCWCIGAFYAIHVEPVAVCSNLRHSLHVLQTLLELQVRFARIQTYLFTSTFPENDAKLLECVQVKGSHYSHRRRPREEAHRVEEDCRRSPGHLQEEQFPGLPIHLKAVLAHHLVLCWLTGYQIEKIEYGSCQLAVVSGHEKSKAVCQQPLWISAV